MTVANIYWLDHIQPTDRSLVGNKAFHLGCLLQKGYPVVPGFVISAKVLREFLETIDWSVPLFADLPESSLRLDIENAQQLQAIAQQLRHAIQTAVLPDTWVAELGAAIAQLNTPTVILRPSLAVESETHRTRSAAKNRVAHGRSSALFNARACAASSSQLVAALKQLWAELFSARSLFYWQRSGIPLNQIRLAVLVQPLWSPVAAGVARTDPALIEVESTIGLGTAIAQGEVIPDLHQIEVSSGQVWGQKLGKKTIAYHGAIQTASAGNPVPTLGAPSSCLTPTLVGEAQQAQFALSQEPLNDLVKLVQNLIPEMGTSLEIEWLLAAPAGDLPRLYLTQFIPTPLVMIERLPAMAPSQPVMANATPDAPPEELLIAGLGVASGEAIARATVILDPEDPLLAPMPGRVLVAPSIPIHWLPLIQQAAAIVTEQGGMTSHSAIIAREMGIPAVMGAEAATRQIQTDDLVRVDGTHGRVYRLPETSFERTFNHQSAPPTIALLPNLQVAASLITAADQPRPPLGTQLMVNLSQPHRLPEIAHLPIDGVGLLRSELLIMAHLEGRHPLHWLQQGQTQELIQRLTTAISQLAAAFSPRPVFYRSLDLRSHEFRGLSGGAAISSETNPLLGRHGTYSYTIDSALFELELAVLRQVQQKEGGNIRLLLPFVRTVAEFEFCLQKIQQVGLTQHPHFQTWIMAEVPSVLFLLPEFVRAGVQGISIGSNDLTQLLLAVDRDDALLSSAFDERHPAVKAAIAHLIQAATAANIPCSICGQAPVHYPELIADLIAWGITTISVEPEALEATYWAIARAERQLLLAATRYPRSTTPT